MPETNEVILGGHAVVVCGYEDDMTANGETGYFIIRNSWGSDWGSNGYFYMPYKFVPKGCFDCWILETVS